MGNSFLFEVNLIDLVQFLVDGSEAVRRYNCSACVLCEEIYTDSENFRQVQLEWLNRRLNFNGKIRIVVNNHFTVATTCD